MCYDLFLKNTPRDKDDYLLISPHRKYQHDEFDYDNQYAISPYDYLAGQGLFNIAKNLNLNIDNPILEIACGTGRLSVGLLKAFDPNKVLITDASSLFLDISKKKFQQNGLDVPELGLLQFEDIEKIPDESMSLIVIRSALHHVDKYQDFICAASKKLVKNGAMIFQEPLYEGLFIMGLIAKFLQKSTTDKDILKDLVLLSDTMRFYCRNDVDKSLAEDKYVFRLNDILKASNSAGLNVQFYANSSFEDFAGEPSLFNYSSFVKSYLKYCMSFSDRTVNYFMEQANDVLEYILEISGIDRAPESSGVIVLIKA